MTFYVIPNQTAGHKRKQQRRVTCVTCNLKQCVGRCRFEVAPPKPSKAA